ncbi:MAG: aldehyde dehydrogenase family protein [Firmicutes bacterium]|nr:aldehyde dehydrogenase family protein [Bacillota bacterium]
MERTAELSSGSKLAGQDSGPAGSAPAVDPSAALYARGRGAASAWAGLDLADRLAYFRLLRLVIVERLDEIARRIASTTGKPPVEALTTEVLPALEAIRYIERRARAALAPTRAKTPLFFLPRRSTVFYKPRGLVLVIAPWNFPFFLTIAPLLDALVGGNAVVVKPSEVTPEIGTVIAELFEVVKWPRDVVQVVQGGPDVGAALVEAGPDFIFFTGSTRTGRRIQEAAARQLIPTTLELGGKDPMVVFADANLDRAARAAAWGGLMNAGQVCMSVERLYVQESVLRPFVERLSARVAELRVGGETADVGRMTHAPQREIVRAHVLDALARGAELACGTPPADWPEAGLIVPPMILTGVTHEMRIMREETFGPVLPVMAFNDEAHALALANDSAYGLSASVWTADVARGTRFVQRLRTGNALVNDVVVSVASHDLPFGGEGASGLGRYHGIAGMRAFCVQTSVMTASGRANTEINWFPYAGKYDAFSELVKSEYGAHRSVWPLMRAYRKLARLSANRER